MDDFLKKLQEFKEFEEFVINRAYEILNLEKDYKYLQWNWETKGKFDSNIVGFYQSGNSLTFNCYFEDYDSRSESEESISIHFFEANNSDYKLMISAMTGRNDEAREELKISKEKERIERNKSEIKRLALEIARLRKE